MIAKNIIESIRAEAYDMLLNAQGRNSMFSREEVIAIAIGEAWHNLSIRIDTVAETSSPLQLSEMLLVFEKMGYRAKDKRDEIFQRVDLRLENFTYELSQSYMGVVIRPDSPYISADFSKDSIGGITPVSNNPALFMCFLLTSFDASVPEIIRVIKEEEYKASSDYRRHLVREQTIRGLLTGLIDKDDIEYRMDGREGTKCVLELPDDDILLVFTVTDRDLEEEACNLREEIRHIRIAPFARVHDFGDRYSLESYV